MLKGEQLSLRYQVKAQFQDNSCTADVFTVELLAYGVSTVVGQLCQSLVGFTSFEVDLAPYKNQVAQLRFTFQSDEDNNAGFGVALDEVSVEAVYGCDDGDACTATDLCVQGICQGEAQEPCP